jgi:hypothetical protein
VHFVACNVYTKGSPDILFTEYMAGVWWIYNNMGYIVMPCIGMPSYGRCIASSPQLLQTGNNNTLAVFNSPLELICNHLINTGSLCNCLHCSILRLCRTVLTPFVTVELHMKYVCLCTAILIYKIKQTQKKNMV